jgi:hypothetical protein
MIGDRGTRGNTHAPVRAVASLRTGAVLLTGGLGAGRLRGDVARHVGSLWTGRAARGNRCCAAVVGAVLVAT